MVYPDEAEIHIFDAATPGQSRLLHRGDVLDGGTLIPGLRLDLAALFVDEPAPVRDVL